jgi:hypothetical protein
MDGHIIVIGAVHYTVNDELLWEHDINVLCPADYDAPDSLAVLAMMTAAPRCYDGGDGCLVRDMIRDIGSFETWIGGSWNGSVRAHDDAWKRFCAVPVGNYVMRWNYSYSGGYEAYEGDWDDDVHFDWDTACRVSDAVIRRIERYRKRPRRTSWDHGHVAGGSMMIRWEKEPLVIRPFRPHMTTRLRTRPRHRWRTRSRRCDRRVSMSKLTRAMSSFSGS